MDLGTGLSLLGPAVLVAKVLGPSADYFGKELAGWAEKRTENLKRIFTCATRKLGDRIEQDGAVPVRVLREVVNSGSYHEEPVAVEYFGGVLASSRTDCPRDDRGASMCKLIDSLSSYELRAHYVIYSVIRRLYRGEPLSLQIKRHYRLMATAVPLDQFLDAMSIDQNENHSVMPHIMSGLKSKALVTIDGGFRFGSADWCAKWATGPKYERVVVFEPSALGAVLFLWAHGRGDVPPTKFLDANLDIRFDISVDLPHDAKRRFDKKKNDTADAKG